MAWRARVVGLGLVAAVVSLGLVSGAQADSFGPPVTIGSGFLLPSGVAVDAAGNVFVADNGNERVVEVPASGGHEMTFASGFYGPRAVAVDAVGDVFVSNDGNEVVEYPAAGGPQKTIGSGLSGPFGLAVDGAGDLFIANAGDPFAGNTSNEVVELPAGGGSQTTIGSDFDGPTGVAVDAAGDVFVADTENNRVMEVPADGGPEMTIGSGFAQPWAVAVDAAGDVFVADTDHNRVVEVPADGGPQTTIAAGLAAPEGLAVDAAGDVFIAEHYAPYRVLELPVKDPTSTSVSCVPAASGTQTCIATVSDTSSPSLTPTGTVKFTGPGSFSDPGRSCTLSSASCSVSYTPAGSSPQKITATYHGDETHQSSAGTAKAGGADVTLQFPASDPTSAVDGSMFSEAVTVTNNGPSPTPGRSGMAISIPPASSGLTAIDLDGGQPLGHQVSWKLPVLAPGESVNHTVTFQVATDASGRVTLTGFTAPPENDPDLANDRATFMIAIGPANG